MDQFEVTVYYLETRSPPNETIPPPRDDLTVVLAQKPTVPYYRFLYDTVGRAYYWNTRSKLSDEELSAWITDPRNKLHVLFAAGVPAGFAELDYRVENEVEITQFGLMPEFIGQGLGKYFLNWTLHEAWRSHPERVWLHTCTADHPAALPNYLKAGFVLYKTTKKLKDRR
ncbi:MAG: N-acetyltransferase [Gemmatales bacterium]|nr:MAG: N-acetyltransferase [Gemmatales bacterium]